METFPLVDRNQVQQMLRADVSIESAIEILLSSNEKANNMPMKDLSMKDLLHTQKVKLILEDTTDLVMARSCIVNKAKLFYKTCLHQASRLQRSLSIQFSGEEGIDVGALKNDFFIAYFKNIQEELFEGQSNRLVPKNHRGSDSELEMAGAAIAHSLLLGGPGFKVVHPAVYSHLALRPFDLLNCSDLPCADDIPLNAATEDTKVLIDKVLLLWCFLLIATILHAA